MTQLIHVTLTIILVALTACSAPPAQPQAEDEAMQLVQSSKPRQSAPPVAEADLSALVEGNSTFAVDLYQTLRGEEGNLFFSPYSISIALAMTYAGARNQTEVQMAEALHYTLPQERLHPTFNALDQELARRAEVPSGDEEQTQQGFRLNIANSIWGQDGYQFLTEFLDVLAENYGAGLRLLDFEGNPEGSRETINDWVANETEQKIKDLLQPGTIKPETRLVLANAIYFNAPWQRPFEPSETSDQEFFLLDGSTVTVPMMRQSENFGYAAGDGYQALELAYLGGETAILILLPDEGNFDAFEQSLTAERLAQITAAMGYQKLDLTLPKFTFESEFSLVEALIALGMPDAFSMTAADFSGMDGGRNLFISDVAHKAFVDVNEEGTEAAAATAVIMQLTSAFPTEPQVVRVDRPFIFLIRDRITGSILFLGRVTNPES